ncbi:MAG: hypothetical protein Q9M92_10380 [Enterobacterales bacterium]|nr:hypothetical protein [Enterobacterales bacterium]
MTSILKLILGFFLLSALALADSSKTTWRLQMEELKGSKLYKNGQFERAFKLLQPLAQIGLKQAQYFVAFMYMQGQGTQADPIAGMAWLAVAKESNITKWKQQYQQAVSLLNPQQKEQLAIKQQQFIELYGMKKQRIICEVRQHSTRARDKRVILCFKDKLGVTESFDI